MVYGFFHRPLFIYLGNHIDHFYQKYNKCKTDKCLVEANML